MFHNWTRILAGFALLTWMFAVVWKVLHGDGITPEWFVLAPSIIIGVSGGKSVADKLAQGKADQLRGGK